MYDTLTGELLQELRRGTDKAEIVCIAFNAGSSMLACTSDKGTVHIFKLNDRVASDGGAGGALSGGTYAGSGGPAGGEGEDAGKPGHNPSFGFMRGMGGMLPKYFSSEWSFSQFRVPDARSIVAFGNEPNTIISE